MPASWITAEVNAQMMRLKQSPQFQHDPEAFFKQMGKNEDQLAKEFEKSGEVSLKTYLGLAEILKKENIELDKDEMANAKKRAEHQASHQKDISEQRKSQLMDQVVQNMKIDKYISSIMI